VSNAKEKLKEFQKLREHRSMLHDAEQQAARF
jgi:hypothetical protein